jgi:hypothetical protein
MLSMDVFYIHEDLREIRDVIFNVGLDHKPTAQANPNIQRFCYP